MLGNDVSFVEKQFIPTKRNVLSTTQSTGTHSTTYTSTLPRLNIFGDKTVCPYPFVTANKVVLVKDST